MKVQEYKRLAIRQIHEELNIPVEVKLKEGIYDRFLVYPAAGVRSHMLKRASYTVCRHLGSGTRFFFSPEEGCFVYETPSELQSRCRTLESLTMEAGLGEEVYRVDLPMVVGQGADGKSAVIDLNDAGGVLVMGSNSCQVLKNSVHTLREIRPGDVRYAVLSSEIEVTQEERLYNCCGCNPREASAVFYLLVNEIERRKAFLSRNGVDDIWTQRRVSDRRLPYAVAVVPDFDKLIEDKKNGDKIAKYAIQIVTQGRTVGVHIVVGMSKPGPIGIQTLLNFNFNHHVLLKMSKEDADQMRCKDACRLLENADGLIRHGDDIERVALISPIE